MSLNNDPEFHMTSPPIHSLFYYISLSREALIDPHYDNSATSIYFYTINRFNRFL